MNITRCIEGKPLPIAHVEPVYRKQSELSAGEIKVLQEAFVKYAEKQAAGKNKIADPILS